LSGEGSKEHEHQHSVIRKAVEASPARQADWLIRTYSDRDILVEISEFSGPESYEVREARKTLVQRGVTLTDEQERQLVASDKAVFANKVMRSGSNAPIIVGGPLKLQYLKEQLMVEFSTKGDRSIVCVGALNEALVPKDLVSCAHSHSECKFPGKMLAIVWKVDSSTQNVVLSVIPMAIW